VVFLFVDIGGIVDHHCLNSLSIIECNIKPIHLHVCDTFAIIKCNDVINILDQDKSYLSANILERQVDKTFYF